VDRIPRDRPIVISDAWGGWCAGLEHLQDLRAEELMTPRAIQRWPSAADRRKVSARLEGYSRRAYSTTIAPGVAAIVLTRTGFQASLVARNPYYAELAIILRYLDDIADWRVDDVGPVELTRN